MTTPRVVSYAAKIHWHFNGLPPGEQLSAFFGVYLENLARDCMATGAVLIGHIKALAEASEKDFVKISVVDTARPAQIDGRLPDGCQEAAMTLNVNVYGLSSPVLAQRVQTVTRTLQIPWQGEARIEPAAHPVHADHLVEIQPAPPMGGGSGKISKKEDI